MPTRHEGGSGTGATILVVDDDDAVRAVASKVLRRAGYAVLEASSGPEALRVVRERGGGIDLLLTDVMMPGLNGRELAERLHAEFPGLRVLFMSAYTEDQVLLRGLAVQDVAFVAKPFDLATLTRAVREAVARPPAEGPP